MEAFPPPPPPSRGAAKVALLLTPPILAMVLLAAHFLRFAAWPLVLLCLALPFVLFARRTWAVRVVELALLIGAVSWASTTFRLVEQRMHMGQPYLRMALILGGVAAFTLLAIVFLETPALKRSLRRRDNP